MQVSPSIWISTLNVSTTTLILCLRTARITTCFIVAFNLRSTVLQNLEAFATLKYGKIRSQLHSEYRTVTWHDSTHFIGPDLYKSCYPVSFGGIKSTSWRLKDFRISCMSLHLLDFASYGFLDVVRLARFDATWIPLRLA